MLLGRRKGHFAPQNSNTDNSVKLHPHPKPYTTQQLQRKRGMGKKDVFRHAQKGKLKKVRKVVPEKVAPDEVDPGNLALQ